MTDSDCPDDELVERTRGGDDQAFELLMRRHAEPIRRLIARYCRNRSMVDDLAQETFVKAYFRLGSFRNESPFIYWLKQVAIRLCIDEMRRRKVRGGEEETIDSVAERMSGPDQRERAESRMALNKVLGPLSPVDRMVLVLLYGEGYGVGEVAGLTGLSGANVKVRAFRLRRRLRALYGGEFS